MNSARTAKIKVKVLIELIENAEKKFKHNTI
jgi:hypothetical protein